MDLETLRVVVAVADGRSIQAAARSLPASRATVRRRLEQLEAEVGAPLFRRDPGGLTPTAAGEILVTRGREMVAEAAVLVRAAASVGAKPRGPLRTMVPPGMPPGVVEAVRRVIDAAFPELLWGLSVTDRPLSAILEHADLVVSLDDAPVPDTWDILSLGVVRERLLASPAYLASSPPVARPADLARHRLLVWQPPGAARTDRLPTLAGGELAITPHMICNDIFTLQHLVRAGGGIGFLPDGPVPADMQPPGEAVPVLDAVVGRHRPLRLLTPRALAGAPHVEPILETLRRVIPFG